MTEQSNPELLAETGIGVVTLADVRARPVDWLWPDRIPFGAITMLDGDPDQGKSLIGADVGARVTTGSPMPGSAGQREPAGVLVIAGEDDFSSTHRPRFDVAGADATLVHLVSGMSDSEGHVVSFMLTSESIRGLAKLIGRLGVRFVLIDPLMNYLPPGIDSNSDQQVRSVLRPLAEVAQRLHVAVLINRHNTKQSGGSIAKRGAGSMGIIGAARAGLIVEQSGKSNGRQRRLLRKAKGNLARQNVEDVPYFIVEVQHPDPTIKTAPRIDWCDAMPSMRDDEVERAEQTLADRVVQLARETPGLTRKALSKLVGGNNGRNQACIGRWLKLGTFELRGGRTDGHGGKIYVVEA